MATSVSFLRNWAVSKVLEAATWKSNSVFASFCLNDVSYIFEGLRSFGAFVAAGAGRGSALIIFYFRLFCLWYVRLFRQNTYLRNKKHTLTCQGGNWFYKAVNYRPGS